LRNDDHLTTTSLEIPISLCTFGFDAVKKAAYKFTDQYEVRIGKPTAEQVSVCFTPKASGIGLDRARKDFENEVLDQELRERIGRETQGIRDLILAQAFSRVSLLHPGGDSTAEGA